MSRRAARSRTFPWMPVMILWLSCRQKKQMFHALRQGQTTKKQNNSWKARKTHNLDVLWGFHWEHTPQQRFFHPLAPSIHRILPSSNARPVIVFVPRSGTPNLNVSRVHSANEKVINQTTFGCSPDNILIPHKCDRNDHRNRQNNLNHLLSSLYCDNSSIQEFGLVNCPKTTLTNLERRREVSGDFDNFLHGILHNARLIPLDCGVV